MSEVGRWGGPPLGRNSAFIFFATEYGRGKRRTQTAFSHSAFSAAAENRALPTKNVAVAEVGVRNAQAELQRGLGHFRKIYMDHLDVERERKERAVEMESRKTAENERLQLEAKRDKRVLRRRKERGASTLFPSLPLPVTDVYAHAELDGIKREYAGLLTTIRQRRARKQTAVDLESKAAALLAQGRSHVRTWTARAETALLSKTRFPKVPAGHASTAQLRELQAQCVRIKDRARKAKTEARFFELEAQAGVIIGQAIEIVTQCTL
jgi:hypothetical protein